MNRLEARQPKIGFDFRRERKFILHHGIQAWAHEAFYPINTGSYSPGS
jgi:hypothetical protein